MKKLILSLLALLMLVIPVLAEDGGTVTLTRETIPLIANFRELSYQPYLRYADVVYIPLDGYHQALLGITVTENDENINIDSYDSYKQLNINDSEYAWTSDEYVDITARRIIKPVYLNSVITDYPFFCFNGEIYMPLSWHNLQCMNWSLDFDKAMLQLYADSKFAVSSTTNPATTNFHTDFSRYQVRGKYCVEMYESITFYSEKITLFIYHDGERISIDGTDFTNMWFENDVLKVLQVVPESYTPPPHGKSIPSIESSTYEITIDINTGEILEKILIDTISRDMYGLYVHSDGSIYTGNTIRYNPGYHPPTAAYYDGGHVILNGTMMRSYSLVDSTLQSSYWIRAEDLENYGYDMVVDFENRSTSFFRNPDKQIAPMDFEGTNERLPIYDSDWKIYIGGKEPKYSYNIDGYTLVFAGELGEYSISNLNSNYKVMNVVTSE